MLLLSNFGPLGRTFSASGSAAARLDVWIFNGMQHLHQQQVFVMCFMV